MIFFDRFSMSFTKDNGASGQDHQDGRVQVMDENIRARNAFHRHSG